MPCWSCIKSTSSTSSTKHDYCTVLSTKYMTIRKQNIQQQASSQPLFLSSLSLAAPPQKAKAKDAAFDPRLALLSPVVPMAGDTASAASSSSSHPPAAFPATRHEIQAAIAKATELRALHAALLQSGGVAPGPNAGAYASYAGAGAGASWSPAVIRVPPAASPALPRVAAVAEDYPVFTPAYGEEPLGGMNYIRQDNRSLSENWSGIGLDHEGQEDEVAFSDLDNHNTFSSSNSELHFSSSNECMRTRVTRRNHHSVLRPALSADSYLKSDSRRTELAEQKAMTTCNTCKPATISRDPEADVNSLKNIISGVPPSSYHPSISSRTKQKGNHVLSWLLPKSKRKPRSDMSPNTNEGENMSQLLKEWGVFSLESLKKELAEANEHRDAALEEVGEMRSSLGELTSKLLSLEAYSSELKKALKKATNTKNVQSHSKRSVRSVGVVRDDSLPVSHEVMVEGFLQVVSEARLSIKQFCKVLLQQVEDVDNGLSDKLNLLLQPYQLTLADRHSKVILYHLEALMNQAMYQDFENCTFQKNGSPRFLDPQQDLQESFASFVALRNLSWNEVLKKGTKYYCEDFSRFCDQKMSCIVSTLSWSWPWAEQLLQCFFVAAKCIWLLHLLAFSFSPPLMILRVEEDRAFDPMYMEEIQVERQRPQQSPSRVKVMAMPGFYVQDKVLKCRVICRYS